MTERSWLPAPVGIDSSQWITRLDCRVILVVAHTIVSWRRVADVAEYVEDDSRIQVVFTVAPDAFNNGVEDQLDKAGALVLPWQQAIRERFDLAIAAAYGGLREIHSPIMVMAHGAGRGKIFRADHSAHRDRPAPTVYGLDAERLIHDGRLLPAALLLSHEREREVLARQCPAALAVAMVVGDPCFDRLVASASRREDYRRDLGVEDGQPLVLVSSTWGPTGLFGRSPELLPALLRPSAQGSGPVRVAALLHPAVWSAHGRRQVRAWLRESRAAGLILLEPDDDWRAAVVASDFVIGDHGSVPAYAAAIGRPVLRPSTWTNPLIPAHGAQGIVMAAAGRLAIDRPLLPQLRRASAIDPAAVAAALTSRPGQAEALIRRELYRLIGLPQPTSATRAGPTPVAGPLTGQLAGRTVAP